MLFSLQIAFGQETTVVSGFVWAEGKKISAANVHLLGTAQKVVTDSTGFYSLKNVAIGNYTIQISRMGFQTLKKKIEVAKGRFYPMILN